MERNTKKVSDSMVEQVFQVRPEHLNGAGRLFGGQLMAWIDEVAGLVGIRHSNGDVITASVDNLKFMRGAYLKDLIVLVGRITYVGHTSMDVRVDTYIEDHRGIRRSINRAYLTLVAVDENDKPRPVPGLTLENESEQACSCALRFFSSGSSMTFCTTKQMPAKLPMATSAPMMPPSSTR